MAFILATFGELAAVRLAVRGTPFGALPDVLENGRTDLLFENGCLASDLLRRRNRLDQEFDGFRRLATEVVAGK